jgi:hypothetical protein
MRIIVTAAVLIGALASSSLARAADAACALPQNPKAIPAAIDAAITGPADKDRACMKALFTPEARMIAVTPKSDGTQSYLIMTLDDWITHVKTRGHEQVEEKQLKFHTERFGNIVHLWSTYAVSAGGKQLARGINSIQAIKESGGWRILGVLWQAESPGAPIPKEYLP